MKEANPFLTDAVAEHLTLHGTNWNADGSIIWKFDNYARLCAPYGMNMDEAEGGAEPHHLPGAAVLGPRELRAGSGSAPEAAALEDRRIVKVDHAGHWVHHDQLEIFLRGDEEVFSRELTRMNKNKSAKNKDTEGEEDVAAAGLSDLSPCVAGRQ